MNTTPIIRLFLTGANTKNIDTVLASIRAGTKKLRPTPLGKKQKYLSDKTWQLILERQHEHSVGNTARVTDLTRLVKKEARKDKKNVYIRSTERFPAVQ